MLRVRSGLRRLSGRRFSSAATSGDGRAVVSGGITASGSDSYLKGFEGIARTAVARRGWHIARLGWGSDDVCRDNASRTSNLRRSVRSRGANVVYLNLDEIAADVARGVEPWQAAALSGLVHGSAASNSAPVPREALLLVGTVRVGGPRTSITVQDLAKLTNSALHAVGLEALDILLPVVPPVTLQFGPSQLEALLAQCERITAAGATQAYGVASSHWSALDTPPVGQPVRTLFHAAEAAGGAGGHSLVALSYPLSLTNQAPLAPLYADAQGHTWSLAELVQGYGITQFATAPLDCSDEEGKVFRCTDAAPHEGVPTALIWRQLFEAGKAAVEMEQQWGHRWAHVAHQEVRERLEALQGTHQQHADNGTQGASRGSAPMLTACAPGAAKLQATPIAPPSPTADGVNIGTLVAAQAPAGPFGSLRAVAARAGALKEAEQGRGRTDVAPPLDNDEDPLQDAQGALQRLEDLAERDQTWGHALATSVRSLASLQQWSAVWGRGARLGVSRLVQAASAAHSTTDWARVYQAVMSHLQQAIQLRLESQQASVARRLAGALDAALPHLGSSEHLHQRVARLHLSGAVDCIVSEDPIMHSLTPPLTSSVAAGVLPPAAGSPAVLSGGGASAIPPPGRPALLEAQLDISLQQAQACLEGLKGGRLTSIIFPPPEKPERPPSDSGVPSLVPAHEDFTEPADARTVATVGAFPETERAVGGVLLTEGLHTGIPDNSQRAPGTPAVRTGSATLAARMAALRSKMKDTKGGKG